MYIPELKVNANYCYLLLVVSTLASAPQVENGPNLLKRCSNLIFRWGTFMSKKYVVLYTPSMHK